MMKRMNVGHLIGFTQLREMTYTDTPQKYLFSDSHLVKTKKFYRKNLSQHYGCVNAIEFSNDGRLFASAGDDRRVLVWDVHTSVHGQPNPTVMLAEHRSNIFVVAINNSNTKILSGGNDDLVIMHDIHTAKPLDYFAHEDPVYGISVDPLNDNLFATACDNGELLIHDIRDPPSSTPFCLASGNSAFHTVMFNPAEPRFIVSSNAKSGVALWDVRMPKQSVLNYGGKNSDQCCMSARFSQDGSKILALRRRLPPILYSTQSTNHLFQFNHTGYYNSCTMKSCSFAGSEDQFVVSGSDNFDLYMWKIPTESETDKRLVGKAHTILRGHRSIVNQVRFNSKYSILASSGVEKTIKFWSPFVIPHPNAKSHFETFADYNRRIFSNNDYINLILQSGQYLSFTYDTNRKTTREDPRMLAFFDALVQRDIEGMSDDDDFALESALQGSRPGETTTGWGNSHPLLPSYVHRRESSEIEDRDVSSEPEVDGAPNAFGDDLSPALIQSSSSDDDDNVAPRDPIVILPATESSDAGEEVGNLLFRNKSSQEESQNASKASSSLDEEDPGKGKPREEELKNNIITRLIAQKHEKLVQMAQNHVILEAEGKPKLKRRNMSIMNRLKRLNRKTHSLTMNLLPHPQPPSSSDSSESGNSTSSSSTSSTSTTGSSSDDDDDDAGFLDLRDKVKPLLINASTSTTEYPAPNRKTKRQRTASQRTARCKIRSKQTGRGTIVDDDDKPCTSAAALERQRRTPCSTAQQPDSSSSSSSSVISDRENFIARLEEVSKRLKRVTNDLTSSSSILRHSRFNSKRKQQSTMIRCPSSSSTSSSSDSSSSSESDLASIIVKLPPPKRQKLAHKDVELIVQETQTETIPSPSANDDVEVNQSRETIHTRHRKKSAEYRHKPESSESD